MATQSRRSSLSSIHSTDSSAMDDLFDSDDGADDFKADITVNGKSIFTVGNEYGLSDDERKHLESKPSRSYKDDSYGSPCGLHSSTTTNERDELFADNDINWYVLLWVHRNLTIWILDTSLAFICLFKALLLVCIARKGHRLEHMLNITFVLELCCDLPILVTLFYPVLLKDFFVPAYLHCWLAARYLKKIYDRHTILRCWAVKDYAPHCKQYVYLFNAANKIHLKFVDHVICEDEFSYALLANNCLYPGLSTLISLLVRSHQGSCTSGEPWQKIYGRHAQNEIYHIQLQKSIFFGQYEGFSFPQASADAHQRFGVALLDVMDSESSHPYLQLNPGPYYKLKVGDICFYMSIVKEQNSQIPRSSQSALKTSTVHQGKVGAKSFSKNETSSLQKIEQGRNVLNPFTSLMDSVPNSPTSVCKLKNLNSLMAVQSPDDNTELREDVTTSTEQTSKSVEYLRYNSHCSSAPLLSSSTKDAENEAECIEEDGHSIYNYTKENYNTTSSVGQTQRTVNLLKFYKDMEKEKLIVDLPPVTLSSGFGKTSCHMRSEPRPFCCLKWGQNCEHCAFRNANDARWHNSLIILLSEHASAGIFNFITPLRSASISLQDISPIILLLEDQSEAMFLDTLAHFPLVYYMTGSIWSVDDLLVAGITLASHLVVVKQDPDSNYEGEEFLEDSATIVAVQKIVKLFPNVTVLTELSQTSNMRFMNISSLNYALYNLKQKIFMSPHMDEIFRMPFAAGHVFSASMLDTLLYQTFTKGYLISFIRLLLGIDGEQGSGHVSSILVKKSTVRKFEVYGNLYKALCGQTGEILFAIHRTEPVPNSGSLCANLPNSMTEHNRCSKVTDAPSMQKNIASYAHPWSDSSLASLPMF